MYHHQDEEYGYPDTSYFGYLFTLLMSFGFTGTGGLFWHEFPLMWSRYGIDAGCLNFTSFPNLSQKKGGWIEELLNTWYATPDHQPGKDINHLINVTIPGLSQVRFVQ
jgi:hypothetical protein